MYLKSVSKFLALNFKIVGVSPSCIRFLSFGYQMKALLEQNLIFEILWSKGLWISNLKGMKKSNCSPKGPTMFKSCEMKLWLPLITRAFIWYIKDKNLINMMEKHQRPLNLVPRILTQTLITVCFHPILYKMLRTWWVKAQFV